MNVNTNIGTGSMPTRHSRVAITSYTIKKATFVRGLLSSIFYLSLWRTTGMFYGYPGTFDEDVSVDPLPMKLILYSLIPLIGIYIALEPNRVLSYFKSVPKLIWLILFATIASLPYSIDFGASIRGLAAVILLMCSPLLYRLRYGSVDTFRILANFAIVSAFLNIVYTVVFPQFAVMGGSYAGMVKGLFYHKNGMGQFCAVAFLFLVSVRSPKARLTYSQVIRWTAVILTLALVVLAQSSTAVVMVCVGLSTMIGLKLMQGVPNSAVRGGILFALSLLGGIVVSSIYLGVAESIAEAFGKDLTFSGRTDIWDQVIPLIFQRPWLGYGYATFRQSWVVEQYVILNHTVHSLHNTYLEMTLNIGIIGSIAWIAFCVQRLMAKIAIYHASPVLNEVQAKEVAIMVLVMIGGMTEAGMMWAPSVLWPIMAVALPLYPLALPFPARRRTWSQDASSTRTKRGYRT